MYTSLTRLTLLLIALILVASSPIAAQEESEASVVCPEGEATLVIAAGTVGPELDLLNRQLDEYMALCPNITINALESPDLATERLQLYLQFLGGRSAAVDIYQIDVIWPRIVAEHMVDLYEFIDPDSEVIQAHFDHIIENNTVNGRLIGMPWFTDAGLFFYRTDLLEKYDLEVPSTWDELEIAAQIIQDGERGDGNADFWGYVWQGNIGEPATINALEWQASNGGGQIISPNGVIEVNNDATIDAIERAANWIGFISPDTVLGHRPVDSLAIFKAGNAAFMRNWPFAYTAAVNDADSTVADRFDVGVLPAGDSGESASVLGGWQLAVSRYSDFPAAAVSVVTYLTSEEVQRVRAIDGGYNPTINALYEDPEVLEVSPLFNRLLPVFLSTVSRPSLVVGNAYEEVSSMYSEAVYAVLSGQIDARTAMEDLEYDLEDLMLDIE